MIGSLLYMTASQPDIMFSVYLYARFQADPKESHLTAVKRILIYLLGTQNLGIWYPRNNTSFEIIGYSDSDFTESMVDRKSTYGTCKFLGQSLISWSSRK
ncbi:putative mitochondrial protein [Dendrobium catenatum]|uniref:Putative mitochondrial protein n=1 Tax=Dendrobium catenatum TaxID=906689 RepID=A0A2I0WWS3_9ASPA|nr:putative mitochondrial protein [Dendrobium catenatum]